MAQLVLNLTDVSDIAAGQATMCAILGGRVWCWGQNAGSSLGSNNTNRNFASTPVLNSDFTDAERIWAPRWGSFVVQSPANPDVGFGQGDVRSVAAETRMVVNTRHELGNTSNIEEVDGWEDTSCLISRTQLVSCWGRNDVGQAGNGFNPSDGMSSDGPGSPTLVVGLSAAVRVGVARSSTNFFACALEVDSEIRCWGRHSNWATIYPQGIGVAQLWGVGPSIGLKIELVPSAPVIIASVAGDRNVSVSWTAPASDGGATITNYEYSTDNGKTWKAFSPADTSTPLVITRRSDTTGSQVKGATYKVRIRAINSKGKGTASTSKTITAK